MVTEFDFDGVQAFRTENSELCAQFISLGAAVQRLEYKGRNIILSADSTESYLSRNDCIGGIVGRYANRIANAEISVGGRKYSLCANNNGNTLHGGTDGLPLHKRLWRGDRSSENSVRFFITSPDGDNGFPGQADICVKYTLEKSGLRIDLYGESDAETVFGPTSHLYFNLSGQSSILEHKLYINADSYLETDSDLIPLGEPVPAVGEFDFSSSRRIGRDYDHCFALNGQNACVLEGGGLKMNVRTDYPGLQIYTGRYLEPPFAANAGVAIEPEYFPDSPNRPTFPYRNLSAGELWHKYILLSFEEA